ncbi:metallophosphoesterase family protein [Parapedobacter sp. GCM10030251]|uniref:metallophosphoesterase family protein n=1 Tax=Parapedobacter sp. GCM10030251 TaxID=3273419 RepID=UPI00361DBDB5
MKNSISRRKFIASSSLLAAYAYTHNVTFAQPVNRKDFSFMLLGDLHFDKLSHHDMEYVKARYPNDIRQIQNYSMVTERYLPSLLKKVKREGKASGVDFYIQLGDFLEGLCGSKSLARLQATEFIELINKQRLGRPFYVIKGNHDITGAGAAEVFDETVLPWQSSLHGKKLDSACTSFVHHDTRFVFFDCYRAKVSLAWLREDLKQLREKNLIFLVHMPVIPFNARSTWTVFSKESEASYRKELLDLLAAHQAIVFCAHLHKTCVLKRDGNQGSITQVCLGSVIDPTQTTVKDHLQGIDRYGEHLVDLEPDFHPESLALRKAILNREKPSISFFEYADFCGYAKVAIKGDGSIRYSMYQNDDREVWKTFDLRNLIST